MVDKTLPGNLPSPGFVTIVDATEVDQSDWANEGALHTRVLDPDVSPRFYRLTWENISRSTAEGILFHYDHFAPGVDNRGRQWEWTPPGAGAPKVVLWAGPPQLVRITANAYNAVGVLEVALATDLVAAQTGITVSLVPTGNVLVLEGGAIELGYELPGSIPTVPPLP